MIKETDPKRPAHATQADHERDQRRRRQTDPTLDLMKMQIIQLARKLNLAPRSSQHSAYGYGRCHAPGQRARDVGDRRLEGCIHFGEYGPVQSTGVAKPRADHEFSAATLAGIRQIPGRH